MGQGRLSEWGRAPAGPALAPVAPHLVSELVVGLSVAVYCSCGWSTRLRRGARAKVTIDKRLDSHRKSVPGRSLQRGAPA
jgi:hypothetical protein